MSVKSRKGFALLETIVGLVLFLIVLTFTPLFIASVMKGTSSAEKLSYSGDVEEIVRNKIRNLDYYDVDSSLNKGNKSCEDALNRDENTIKIQKGGKRIIYGVYYNIVELEPGVRKRVTVDICWKNRGKLYEREIVVEKTKW